MTSLFYVNEQAERPAAIATITTMNKAVFGVIALLLGYGIVGLAAISIFNNVLTLLVLLWAGRKFIGRIGGRLPDRRLIGAMVSESLPLMLNHFLGDGVLSGRYFDFAGAERGGDGGAVQHRLQVAAGDQYRAVIFHAGALPADVSAGAG